MVERIVGIDPGTSGALAGITLDDGHIKAVTLNDMPIIKIKKGTGKKAKVVTEIDPVQVMAMLNEFAPFHVFIEKAQPMSRYGKVQGVVSTAGYMKGYGILLGILYAGGYDFTEVSPQQWKKWVFTEKMEKIERESDAKRKGRAKTLSRERAQEEFSTQMFPLVKDHNKAEAFLIGLYGCGVL